MARGPSGRVVIEMDPELKRELHSALVADGTTLKDWFIAQAEAHLHARREPGLPGLATFEPGEVEPTPLSKVAEEAPSYRAAAKSPASPTPSLSSDE
jgi:hypothetical protein